VIDEDPPMKDSFRTLTVCLALHWLFPVAFAADRTVPDLGTMLTDDGGPSFTHVDPVKCQQALREMIGSLEGRPVRTLVYEVSSGSEMMYYPTEVASVWGWRKVAGESNPALAKRMEIRRAAVANKLDAVRTAGEKAKEMGLFFLPGYRMNDAHFSGDPFNHPATGRFWIENHKRLTIGASPLEIRPMYANLLDFSHEEVRAHRLAILTEVIDRYADLMDGLQLDFMRHPVLFPPEKGPQRQDLMTDLIARVREKLDEAGDREERFLVLSVRVPPSLEGCHQIGLDLPTWLKRRLVDVLVLSPAMTLSHDMPPDEFMKLAEPVGARVYAGIFRRVPSVWDFTLAPTEESYQGWVDRNVSANQVRGAAMNYRWMGVSGFEMYNFNLPPSAYVAEAIEALAEPRHGERIYAVTQAQAPEREELVEYVRQIPATLVPGPLELTLIVGERLDAKEAPHRPTVALRVGLAGRPSEMQGPFTIELNGRNVYEGPLERLVTPVLGRQKRRSRADPPRVQAYAQLQIPDLDVWKLGRNHLRLELDAKASRVPLQVVEVLLAVYDNEP
jgi:hypothetical protein